APYARPPPHAQALSKRSRLRVLLREELSKAPAAVGRDRDGLERRQQPRHVLLPVPGPTDAGVAFSNCDARIPHLAVTGLKPARAANAGLRPRSWAAGDHRRVLQGRLDAARRV